MIKVTDEMIEAIKEYEKLINKSPEELARRIIELHEQSKPKPEPVAYKICNPAGCVLVESKRQAEKLASEYGDGTYQPLYTTPPTREPLSAEQIDELWRGSDQFFVQFARIIEQAHGIGVKA